MFSVQLPDVQNKFRMEEQRVLSMGQRSNGVAVKDARIEEILMKECVGGTDLSSNCEGCIDQVYSGGVCHRHGAAKAKTMQREGSKVKS